jgi:hypothetical protein
MVLAACSDDTGPGEPESEASVDAPSGSDGAPHADANTGDASDSGVKPDSSAIDSASDAQGIDASDSAVADATDSATVDAHDSGTDATDSTTADAHDSGTDATDSATADAHDGATADARDAEEADVEDAAEDADVTTVATGDAGGDASDATIATGDASEQDAADATTADSGDGSQAADAADAADVYVCPAALQAYQTQYAEAFCYGVGNCCPGYDAGGFDITSCVNDNRGNGYDNTIPQDTATECRGNVIFNPDAGVACLAALRAFPCAAAQAIPSQFTASASAQIIDACLGVFSGTIPIDAGGCTSSWECVEGAYCNTLDGGTICSPLVAVGGPCTSDDMCRSFATGQPANFCNGDLVDAGVGTCQPQQANGTSCQDPSQDSYDWSCTALLCGDDGLCGSNATINFCLAFPGDAGP